MFTLLAEVAKEADVMEQVSSMLCLPMLALWVFGVIVAFMALGSSRSDEEDDR